MDDAEFADAHDRMLASFHRGTDRVFCENKACPNHDGVEIDWVSEYGQSWFDPEDCFICHGTWLETEPEKEEE